VKRLEKGAVRRPDTQIAVEDEERFSQSFNDVLGIIQCELQRVLAWLPVGEVVRHDRSSRLTATAIKKPTWTNTSRVDHVGLLSNELPGGAGLPFI
jgi:hypothetical protein